ncbi:SDR family oxidoreductase [Roseobacter ponti]|uniref:SDR family oxidoreductase n=1 Tax=Roseobacter ponti TaxID=1891787 RepID=A0A858T018_9RHOB|nr:SDR family oxidoreductase [Roseobacter ponti]QJF52506.1 SDR family oxidoreductase [Roseobacter ponti]
MKKALVTGAGHRIGREIAVYLAARGYEVVVHYASSDAGARETVRRIAEQGGRAHALRADLLDDDATEQLFVDARDALDGPVTCLINNASIFEHDTIGTATRESWDRHMQSNLRAPFLLSQAMAAQGLGPARDSNGEPVATGLIVNMVDQRVRKLTPDFMTYTLAKAALWTLTQTMARAMAPAIRVNAIGPGPTLQGGRQEAEQFAQQRAATVLGRGSDPQDITAAVGYFLDAPAVTGQLLCVDGGQHLAWQTPDVTDVE